MDTNLLKLKPELVWKHFSNICALPHPSKHEEKVREYIVNFAKENNIETIVDEVGNVILYVPATAGYENRKTITMQGHIDMVPQKNSDKDFDFETDPIEAYIDGEIVTANGTTLGADNGIGAAAALAVMEECGGFEHGAIEALFTIDEEAGMTGAFALKPGVLRGDILLNMDSEEEGELYVGCAGGVDVVANIEFERAELEEGYKGFRIDVKGLKGGHSGIEIILQRGNSNKILARIIHGLMNELEVELSEINGGNMRNAIPREGHAVVAVVAHQVEEFKLLLEKQVADIKNELSEVDADLEVVLTECETPETVIELHSAYSTLMAVNVCPNGVDRMSDSIPGLVETSSNLGILVTKESSFEAVMLVRSSIDSAKADLVDRIVTTFEGICLDCECQVNGGYSGWKPNLESPILKTMQETYEKMYGKTPKIMAIHAGLECGILGATYPNLDMISFGPTICFPHSPDESVNIASVAKMYDFLLETIKNAPLK
ncbi:MAG: aminoacyl-histidine dipeptidase [Rikenellaceae bacterium]